MEIQPLCCIIAIRKADSKQTEKFKPDTLTFKNFTSLLAQTIQAKQIAEKPYAVALKLKEMHGNYLV